MPSYHLGARRGIAGLGVSMAVIPTSGLTAGGAGGLTTAAAAAAAAAAAFVPPGEGEKEAASLQLYAAEVEQLRGQWEQANPDANPNANPNASPSPSPSPSPSRSPSPDPYPNQREQAQAAALTLADELGKQA